MIEEHESRPRGTPFLQRTQMMICFRAQVARRLHLCPLFVPSRDLVVLLVVAVIGCTSEV